MVSTEVVLLEEMFMSSRPEEDAEHPWAGAVSLDLQGPVILATAKLCPSAIGLGRVLREANYTSVFYSFYKS